MVITADYNEQIATFFQKHGIKLHDQPEVILADRTSMVQKAPKLLGPPGADGFGLTENDCYQYWMGKLRNAIPDPYICWGIRTDDWIGVEAWVRCEAVAS